jgi:hypothetical protein
MANPRGQQRDKPYRDALRIEAKLAEDGEDSPAPKGSLRWIARQQLERAGEDTSAAKEIADRLDGKVAQPVSGDDDGPPINVLHRIERVIVRPNHDTDQNGGSLPPAA